MSVISGKDRDFEGVRSEKVNHGRGWGLKVRMGV